jgi:Domain of unknown function (DUF6895)
VSHWNDADLEARLCRALDIALKTVTCFGIDGHTDAASPVYSFGPEKPLAETAMLMYASASCHDRPAVRARIDALVAMLVPLARSERVMLNIALNPALVFKFAAPHVLLTRLGYGDESFDAFLESCLASEASDGVERPPSARIEKQWLSSLRRAPETGGAWASDLAGSVLDTPLDILGGRRDDTYAWTHLVMYATDFGNEPRRALHPPDRSGQAGALLARYLDIEDYDLAGEVLLAWPLTASAWSPAAAFGFKVLAGVEDQVRVLPCGNMSPARVAALDGEERFRYVLATAYHTAYVMGFLCAASLRTGRTPPLTIPAGQCDSRALDALLPYIDEAQGHWQAGFARLTGEAQRALTPFVLDMAIVQTSRRRDYAAMVDVLSHAQAYGLSDAPLCRQATELLNRIASCGTAMASRNLELSVT